MMLEILAIALVVLFSLLLLWIGRMLQEGEEQERILAHIEKAARQARVSNSKVGELVAAELLEIAADVRSGAHRPRRTRWS